ncbi:MAG: hypothetical protein AAF707_05160 [Pseudomonadota bacterium]
MLALIAIWAFAEGIVFFIIADVPITALGIKAGWRKALTGAAIASAFAASGGAIVWLWASSSPKDVIALMLAVPAIGEDLIEYAYEDWRANGPIGMMMGSFSGVPYKLYALAAGTVGGQNPQGLALFVIASMLARFPRFALVAVLSGLIGPWLKERIGARAVWTAFALGWVAIYAWYWSTTGF